MVQYQSSHIAIMDTPIAAMSDSFDALLTGIKASETPNADVSPTVLLPSGSRVVFVRPDPTIPAEGGAFVCVFKNEAASFDVVEDEIRAAVQARFGVWPFELSLAVMLARLQWMSAGPLNRAFNAPAV